MLGITDCLEIQSNTERYAVINYFSDSDSEGRGFESRRVYHPETAAA